MAVKEIGQDLWEDFLSVFSEHHRGARVTIEEASPREGRWIEARTVPLAAIEYRRDDGGERIEILVGATGGPGDRHRIERPVRLFHKSATGVMSGEADREEILEIASAAGPPVTRLRLT